MSLPGPGSASIYFGHENGYILVQITSTLAALAPS